MLRKNRDLRLKQKDTNVVRLEVVRLMTDALMPEDKVDRAARTKIRSQKREVPEGSEEWEPAASAVLRRGVEETRDRPGQRFRKIGCAALACAGREAYTTSKIRHFRYRVSGTVSRMGCDPDSATGAPIPAMLRFASSAACATSSKSIASLTWCEQEQVTRIPPGR